MKRLRAYTYTSSFAGFMFIDYFVCINYWVIFVPLTPFCNSLSKCSSIGLDVILVDLREPCSYFKASAFVPFFLGNGSLSLL